MTTTEPAITPENDPRPNESETVPVLEAASLADMVAAAERRLAAKRTERQLIVDEIKVREIRRAGIDDEIKELDRFIRASKPRRSSKTVEPKKPAKPATGK